LEATREKAASYEQKYLHNAAEIQTLSDTITQLKEQLQFDNNEKLRISDKIITERRHMYAKITSLQGMYLLLEMDPFRPIDHQ
jgi:hypothetical protein